MRILSDPEKIIPDPGSFRNESVVICNLTHSQEGNTKVTCMLRILEEIHEGTETNCRVGSGSE
jgi:hypothetical protein